RPMFLRNCVRPLASLRIGRLGSPLKHASSGVCGVMTRSTTGGAIALFLFLGTTASLFADTCILTRGKAVEAYSCSFQVKAGDYIRVVVDPNFVKVSAKLIDPEAHIAAEADNLHMVNT